MRDFANKYELTVKVNSRPVREYSHDGMIFIEGREGSEYSILIKNNTHSSIAAVISVDGLSIADGNNAGLDSKCLIVNAFSAVDVPGWITSKNSANKFLFSSRERSYSERTGQGSSNVGVIGLMVFEEKPKDFRQMNQHPPYFGYQTGYPLNASVTRGAKMLSATSHSMDNVLVGAASVEPLGTGFGEHKDINVTEVNFEKRNPKSPDAILALYYDSRKGLERRGIVVDSRNSLPNAFPSYTTDNTFCKFPTK